MTLQGFEMPITKPPNCDVPFGLLSRQQDWNRIWFRLRDDDFVLRIAKSPFANNKN